MSLYYTIIFVILVSEIVIFTLLSLPMPTKFRRPLTLLLLKPFKFNTVQVSINCILGFIALLFVDSINKLRAIEQWNGEKTALERLSLNSKKFYQQRNMYLCGITLFLTFLVSRIFSLIQELLDLKLEKRTDDKLNLKIKLADVKIKELKNKIEKFKVLDN